MYLLRYFYIDRPVFLLENRVHKRTKHRKVHAKLSLIESYTGLSTNIYLICYKKRSVNLTLLHLNTVEKENIVICMELCILCMEKISNSVHILRNLQQCKKSTMNALNYAKHGQYMDPFAKTAQNFLSNYKQCDSISQTGRIIKFSLLMQTTCMIMRQNFNISAEKMTILSIMLRCCISNRKNY